MAKIQNFVRPLIVVGLVVGMSLMANTASARHRTCHPAAKAHMKTAIRLMTIACEKPLHVAKSLARAASVHVGLSLRFTRNPSAIAQLHAVKASLDHFVHSYCAPPFHTGIEQTRLALTLECNPCACSNPVTRSAVARRTSLRSKVR